MHGRIAGKWLLIKLRAKKPTWFEKIQQKNSEQFCYPYSEAQDETLAPSKKGHDQIIQYRKTFCICDLCGYIKISFVIYQVT